MMALACYTLEGLGLCCLIFLFLYDLPKDFLLTEIVMILCLSKIHVVLLCGIAD